MSAAMLLLLTLTSTASTHPNDCPPGDGPGLCVLREVQAGRARVEQEIRIYVKESVPLPAPPACEAPEHRQFDFWVGEWEVVDSAGAVLGRNVIRRMLDGCVLHEQWSGASGTRGESFNIYDRASGRWHQTWVDSGGTLLQLDGGVEGGAMVMRGEAPGPEGRLQQQRITWSPAPGGTVVQHWETSSDGVAWQTVFRGIYRRTGTTPGG